MFDTIFKEVNWASFIVYYGSFFAAAVGLFYGMATDKWLLRKHLKSFLIIGILGGFIAKAYCQSEIFYALSIMYMLFCIITISAWKMENHVKKHVDDFLGW